MQTKFKRHQKVKLLVTPDVEFIEYFPEVEPFTITKGATGEINMILPNGEYHVAIKNDKGETLAYVPVEESNLESIE